ncbi:MAG: hypothetical protein RID09_31755 [Coleofasciculus sp. G1-WW12-02]
MSLASLTLLLIVGNLTMTACGLVKPINKSTQPEIENQLTEKDSATDTDQDAEAEKQYEAEGIDTIDDDDPE